MLDYGWDSPSQMAGDDSSTGVVLHHNIAPDDQYHGRQLYVDPYGFSVVNGGTTTAGSSGDAVGFGIGMLQHPSPSATVDYQYYVQYGQYHLQQSTPVQSHFGQSVLDPRAFTGASYPPGAPLTVTPVLSLDMMSAAAAEAEAEAGPSGFMMMPKNEPGGPSLMDHYGSPIGLNLGGRTYFSSDDDFISRLYRRSRMSDSGLVNTPRCQAEGCNADLSHAKHYHRRHKVCEFHSKASTVVAAGLTQRFCQQCSRFHLLTEFDNGKRSCRRRLADHNRRRRKSHHQPAGGSSQDAQTETTKNSPSDQNVSRSPPSDSGVQSSSSVTVPASPLRMPVDSFRQWPPYNGSGCSS